jgi:hypothetical protein
MTVQEMLAELQRLPRDAKLLAFEPGCEDYCEREVNEVELQGGRVPAPWGPARRAAAEVAGQANRMPQVDPTRTRPYGGSLTPSGGRCRPRGASARPSAGCARAAERSPPAPSHTGRSPRRARPG